MAGTTALGKRTAVSRPDDKRYASISLRRRDCPGWRGLPTVNTAAATTTAGASGAATAITGSVLIPPWETSAFTYYGAKVGYGGNAYPNYPYYTSGGVTGSVLTYPSGLTTASPYAVEFDLDTTDAKFEILQKGSGGGIRVLVNGQSITATGSTFAPTADGTAYLQLVTLPTAGVYRIRLECSANAYFGGIRVIAGNAVTAAPARSQRWIVLGDSIAEPTISDSFTGNGWDGWVQQLAYLLGVDAWSAGRGGTGYLQQLPANTGANNFLQRITDVTGNAPDVVVFAGGINDYGNFTAAQVGAQALTCFQAVRAALPNTQLIVLSPFFPRGFQSYAANLLATDDAIKAAAAAVGATFLDLLRFPAPFQGAGLTGGGTPAPAPSSTLQASTAVNATSISSTINYGLGTYMQIGTGSTMEIRKVTGSSGTGPYTVNFGGATPGGGGGGLSNTHAAGEPIIPVSQGYLSGTGHLGTVTGDGTADRFTGTDSTHPTVAGHKNLARAVYTLLMPQLPA